MSDDGQKWQQAYQTLLLSNENRDSGIVSQLGSSPTSSRMSSRDPDVRSVDSSGVRDSSILDDSVPDDLPDQVSAFRSFAKEEISLTRFRSWRMFVRSWNPSNNSLTPYKKRKRV